MSDGSPRTTRAFGGYRPGLDGIRAVAVLGVLAYHADFSWARGGFLGVSLFFTLSGFLITGILLDGLRSEGTIELRRFWSRRFRRLAPASLLGLAFAVVYAATIATRSQTEHFGGELIGALAYVVNWVFIGTEQSYADIFAAPSPVQHYWSLGIEEQFYLVIPVALLGLRFAGLRIRGLAVALAAAALAASAWAYWLSEGGATFERLYYGTDTRLTEVLVGATLAAVLDHRGHDFGASARRWFSAIGGVSFLVILWTWNRVDLGDDLLWSGGLLGGALLAAFVILGILAAQGPLANTMEWTPLVWIGRLSYGIYVFHWFVFLWLTETRTGLSQWPLFACRVALTVLVAWVSYRFIEAPIRRGATFGLAPTMRVAAYPALAVVLAVGALVVVDEADDDPLATIRDDAVNLAPQPDEDPILDVALIAEPGNTDVVAEVVAAGAADREVDVHVAEPFRCEEPLAPGPEGRPTCANWLEEWPTLIDEHDPDVVVLFTDGLQRASPDAGTEALDDTLRAGFDLLTARGAPIVWGATGVEFAAALARDVGPFFSVMKELQIERSDLHSILNESMPNPTEAPPDEIAATTAAALLDDATLYRRRVRDAPRILVAGDSQGRSLGYGLERWADENDRAWVRNIGALGCGIADDGEVFGTGEAQPVETECVGLIEEWGRQVEEFRPDMVVVFTSLWDLTPRRLDDWDSRAALGDPEFDRYLIAEYRHAVSVLGATGAQVVWIEPPCLSGPSADAIAPEDIERLNRSVLPKVIPRSDDRGARFDLDAVLCPDGEPLRRVPGADPIRGDGVHFTVDGALWFADEYGDELLRLGGL